MTASSMTLSSLVSMLTLSVLLICNVADAQTEPSAGRTKTPPAAAVNAFPHEHIRNVVIDEKKLRTHVMSPAHIKGVITSKGLQEGKLEFKFPPIAAKPHLDVNGFCKALHATLKDSVAGYVSRLNKNGSPICTLQWNWARSPTDGSLAWNLDRPMHVASVSKLITAIALTKLLDSKKISYDAKIIDYLPVYWKKGPNIDEITFRHLMTHTSGFSTGSSDSDYQFMKSRVAMGVSGVGKYDYENMNFGLCRILIAVINGNIPKDLILPPPVADINDVFWDYVTIAAYKQFVEVHVFRPSSVSGPTLDHPDYNALAYTFPVGAKGWNSGDLTTMSGGAAWHMSTNQLLKIMDTFRRKETIMSSVNAQAMLDAGFGIDVVGMETPAGKLYNKNGRWQDGAMYVEQSLAYFLPENMELVVLANSPVGSPPKFFRDLVTQVYADNIK